MPSRAPWERASPLLWHLPSATAVPGGFRGSRRPYSALGVIPSSPAHDRALQSWPVGQVGAPGPGAAAGGLCGQGCAHSCAHACVYRTPVHRACSHTHTPVHSTGTLTMHGTTWPGPAWAGVAQREWVRPLAPSPGPLLGLPGVGRTYTRGGSSPVPSGQVAGSGRGEPASRLSPLPLASSSGPRGLPEVARPAQWVLWPGRYRAGQAL